MREIKFRVWNKEEKVLFCVGSNPNLTNYQQSIYILQQFTGLKDKNGKEIYEGDIVKYNWTISDRAIIEWEDKYFRWSGRVNETLIPLSGRDTQEFEVIGNIYENPDLLK